MPLSLHLHTESAIPLEVDAIRLSAVRELSSDNVMQLPIHRGNQVIKLGEFFQATGSASEDNRLIWEGDCSRVKSIGAGHDGGLIRVEGDAGMHLGAGMTGGEIICRGSAGDWAGAEMRGGRLIVFGNTGSRTGGARYGSRRGMTGGEILVHGATGSEAGHTLRRGLIAVGGDCGDAAGAHMIAGTLLIFGRAGRQIGFGMKRGTIGLFQSTEPVELLSTFRRDCVYQPQFLPLYLKHLHAAGFPVPQNSYVRSYVRYSGDLLELGLGEILVRSSG